MPSYDRGERDRGYRERDPSFARRRYSRRDDDDDRGPWISRDREPFEPDLEPRENEFRGRQQGGYAGRGPKGYQRSDERLKEEVCERLTADPDVDATEIEVSAQNSEVTLEGTVRTRFMKRAAEDCVEAISGVQQVHNRLRVESNEFGRDEQLSPRGDEGQRSSAGRKAH